MSSHLPYNPETLPRELKKYYISISESEEAEMLADIGKNNLHDLFSHIPESVKFKSAPYFGPSLTYPSLVSHLENVAKMNTLRTSFLGDALPHYDVPQICQEISNLRGLTTAYTPYQPERCQGTLYTLWIYASAISELTGFEAINASLYDRSTCLYEALQTALRLRPGKKTVLVSHTLYPQDLEVLFTLAQNTSLKLVTVPANKNGVIDLGSLNILTQEHQNDLAGFAFPQVNCLGLLENVHALTDICQTNNIIGIGVIDPMQLASTGLIPPSLWGKNQTGVQIIVGEGQHLGLPPLFGGPGLGIYGIRYNDADKNSIRQTAGRYVGQGFDSNGNKAFALVLSTREQHIRREKATSNICSNQSFVATLAGASILARGEKGMNHAATKSQELAQTLIKRLTHVPGIKLAFNGAIYNEFILQLPIKCEELIESARHSDLHIGVNVSSRIKCLTGKDGQFLLLSLFDRHSGQDLEKLCQFFYAQFGGPKEESEMSSAQIPTELKRSKAVNLPNHKIADIKNFYQKLSDLNVSPDDHIYPLGSCTMKYNPYINDYTAGLSAFTNLHPEVPESDAQGSLHILYETQEIFKTITGLAGVTTQPVAGAQGELAGLKMFQAYHQDRNELKQRDIILIPKSAHGTNPATAAMAGIETSAGKEEKGIVIVGADSTGQINRDELKSLVEKYQKRILGIMITNPNTSGIFESNFKQIAELIHDVGGLVYMDGANMNAIASWIDLGAMGVDAVHNNLHKTWTIPHGGGGPGDAIVAVSEKLLPYLPGLQIKLENGVYKTFKAQKSCGSFHRHYGNFAHKVRCYTYLKALGTEGVRKMSAIAVLSANYLYHNLKNNFPMLPEGTENIPRMHEFILTPSKDLFTLAEQKGSTKAQLVPRLGKLFLDFGLHAPTVAFPEIYGLMIEPTESYSKDELDQFLAVVKSIFNLATKHPEVLTTTPHFTPVFKIDEVEANRSLTFRGAISELPNIPQNIIDPKILCKMPPKEIENKIFAANQNGRNKK